MIQMAVLNRKLILMDFLKLNKLQISVDKSVQNYKIRIGEEFVKKLKVNDFCQRLEIIQKKTLKTNFRILVRNSKNN